MTASPLARVLAPKSAPKPRPDYEGMARFIDEVQERFWIDFGMFGYNRSEEAIRAGVAKIAEEFSAKFPDYELVTTVEGPEYRPPFAVSWNFKPKGEPVK